MKKLVILFLSVVTTGFLLTSCSDDDGGASIEGKWEFYQEGYAFAGQEELELYEHTPGCENDFIELFSGGNYQDVFYYNDGEGCLDDTSTGTWSRSGNTVTVTTGGEATTVTILTLNNTTLKVSIPIESEGVTANFISVFKRP